VYPIANGSLRPSGRLALAGLLILAMLPLGAVAQSADTDMPEIKVVYDEGGSRLQVDGKDFMVLGMNWGYMPIGDKYTYGFWDKSYKFI
jgi:hypothetical protein